MTLTKSQLAQLSKWAKSGRLIVRPITSDDLPEWAKHEFRLARMCVALMCDGIKWRDAKEKRRNTAASREALLSVLGEARAKSERKMKSYRVGAKAAWVSRKRQAIARAEAAKQTEKAA